MYIDIYLHNSYKYLAKNKVLQVRKGGVFRTFARFLISAELLFLFYGISSPSCYNCSIMRTFYFIGELFLPHIYIYIYIYIFIYAFDFVGFVTKSIPSCRANLHNSYRFGPEFSSDNSGDGPGSEDNCNMSVGTSTHKSKKKTS